MQYLNNGEDTLAFYFFDQWLLMYIVAAVSGAIMSLKYIFIPVRNKLIKHGNINHPYVKNYLIAGLVWLVLATVLIPFLISSLLMEDKLKICIEAVYEGATND